MRRALGGPTAAALVLAVAASLGGCGSPEAEDPNVSAPPVEEQTEEQAEEQPEELNQTAPHTDLLSRPPSWPLGLDWTLVQGEVEDYRTVDDGAIRLTIRSEAELGPRKLARRIAVDLENAAHSVELTEEWQGGGGSSVVQGQHPDQAIEVRVARDAPGEDTVVQILLNPLTSPEP